MRSRRLRMWRIFTRTIRQHFVDGSRNTPATAKRSAGLAAAARRRGSRALGGGAGRGWLFGGLLLLAAAFDGQQHRHLAAIRTRLGGGLAALRLGLCRRLVRRTGALLRQA